MMIDRYVRINVQLLFCCHKFDTYLGHNRNAIGTSSLLLMVSFCFVFKNETCHYNILTLQRNCSIINLVCLFYSFLALRLLVVVLLTVKAFYMSISMYKGIYV